jgi:hypothetical protein
MCAQQNKLREIKKKTSWLKQSRKHYFIYKIFCEFSLLWYRRFRALCPRGNMTKDKLDIVYHKLFVGGESDFFSKEICRRFDVVGKNYLDFKVIFRLIYFSFLWINTNFNMVGKNYLDFKVIIRIFFSLLLINSDF